jgi:hypothetical protein
MKYLCAAILLLFTNCAVMTKSDYRYNIVMAEIRGQMKCYQQSWDELDKMVTKITDPVLIHDTIYIMRDK